jgi:hypothetical protein
MTHRKHSSLISLKRSSVVSCAAVYFNTASYFSSAKDAARTSQLPIAVNLEGSARVHIDGPGVNQKDSFIGASECEARGLSSSYSRAG